MAHWVESINLSSVWKNDLLSFEETRDSVVHRIRSSDWYFNNPSLQGVVDDLSASEDAAEFDDYFQVIYDLADVDRIWIETF